MLGVQTDGDRHGHGQDLGRHIPGQADGRKNGSKVIWREKEESLDVVFSSPTSESAAEGKNKSTTT